jgi:LysR family hydrogen peroxide-inducible transcriptional activator
MHLPTLQQLRYAVAVADHRHFGRAAQATYVSQPALSAQVRELEGRLRVQLFERTNQGVLLTPRGADIVERARRILSEVDDLVDAAGAGDPLVGPLRMGVIPTVAPYILPTAMRRLVEEHPGLEVYLREDRTAALVGQLLAGELDLLLLALPLHRPGIEEVALYDEPFLLAVPDGHRLATRSRCAVGELTGERLVLLDDGHCLRDQALDVCSTTTGERPPEVQGTSLPTVVNMVAAGLGITLLPASTVRREAGPLASVVVRELTPRPTRTIGLAWRASSANADGYRHLGEVFRAAAEECMVIDSSRGRRRAHGGRVG